MKDFQYILLHIAVCFVFSTLISCSSKGDNSEVEGNIVMHPIEERIPHFDNEHINIDSTGDYEELNNNHKQLKTFQQYLQSPEKFKEKKLDLSVGSTYPSFNVLSVGSERLIILDPDVDKLLEYNLKTDEVASVAETGRGPGDIQYVEEMKKGRDYLYIVESNMQISKFNYRKTPTKFSEVLKLNIRPSSIGISDTSLAVLGMTNLGDVSDNKLDKKQKDFKAITLLDKKGNLVNQFGKIYDIDGHWMLLRPFVFDGFVEYNTKEELFIIGFDRFPFLYVYNATNLELEKTYKVSTFELGKRRYWPDQGQLEVTMEDNSAIRNTQMIDDQFLWIEVAHRENYSEGKWDQEMDYFVVNLNNDKSYYLGSLELGGNIPNQQFFITENGLVIQKKGNLYLVQ